MRSDLFKVGCSGSNIKMDFGKVRSGKKTLKKRIIITGGNCTSQVKGGKILN